MNRRQRYQPCRTEQTLSENELVEPGQGKGTVAKQIPKFQGLDPTPKFKDCSLKNWGSDHKDCHNHRMKIHSIEHKSC